MFRSLLGRAFAFAALATPLALATGCVSRQPSSISPLAGVGSADRGGEGAEGRGDGGGTQARPVATPPPPLPPDAWPPRVPIDQIEHSGREVYLLPSELAPPEERVSIGRRGLGELFRVDVDRIASASDLERIRRDRGFREWLVFQTYLGYVGLESMGQGVTIAVEQVRPDGTVARNRRPIDLVEISETSFAIYLPNGPPRGLVLQLTNLAGNTEWERELTEAFHRDGWAVLSTFVPDGWAATDRLAVDRNDPPERIGVRLAEAIDDRLAEWAYGVEALLDYMQERYPEVPQTPLVGVGSSVGAISLPAVAARLAERRSTSGGGGFDAAVLIGGGIDGLSVLRNTTLQSTPVRLQWADDKRPDRATWEVIRRTYLQHARLDGTTTCAYLRGSPVLLLHAAYDRIVDANCGEALWQVLGRPERWTYQTGHLGLFVFWVPLEIDRIVRWVDEAVGGRAGPAKVQ